MKKLLIIYGVMIFSLFFCGISLAETVGNPGNINIPPGKGVYSAQMSDFITIRAGFDTEFLVEKKFDNKNEGSIDAELDGVYYMGKFSCTLFNRIQPYASAGVADLKMKWKDGTNNVSMESGIAPVWGAGIKAYLWEFENIGLKVFSTASFRAANPHKWRHATVGSLTGDITEKKFELFERQGTLGLSKEFKVPGYEDALLMPYIGVAWSETTARVSFKKGSYPVNSGATGQKDNWGLFFGTDFLVTDNFSLNVEGRLIDQKAANLGFTALF